MQFSRVITPVEDIQIWNASSNGFSFVISYESRSGPGLQGNPGFVGSWRYQNRTAVKVIGSPFKTLSAAEQACEVMLGHLIVQAIAKQMWDAGHRVAMQIAALPPEKREKGLQGAEKAFGDGVEKMGATPEFRDAFVKAEMELIRSVVKDIEASGSPQGGRA